MVLDVSVPLGPSHQPLVLVDLFAILTGNIHLILTIPLSNAGISI
jgi:hypothetical protein